METFFKVIGATVAIVGLIFLVAVISGTILYFIYPSIHALFPTAAAKGIIAERISWWNCVGITWIFAILFKNSSSSSSKKD